MRAWLWLLEVDRLEVCIGIISGIRGLCCTIHHREPKSNITDKQGIHCFTFL